MAGQFSDLDRPARSWRGRMHSALDAPTLGQLVLRRGMVTRQQLAHAIAIQRLSGERLGHVLVRLDYVGDQDMEQVLGRQRLRRWLAYWLG